MSSSPRATAADWLEGARPHTWANAFAPVIAGSAAAAASGGFFWGKALLAAIVSWALIVGVNYANDYSDGIRGTDDVRSGPQRLTGSGLARPQQVKHAAFFSFGIAAIAGTVLALTSAWWLILVGALCIAGAWFYTGGKNPYGYRGFGEISIFVFFGLVAVLGTEFTQAGSVSLVGVLLAIGVGAMSSSVNLVNNLRDIPTDTQAGKITLAVRLGDTRTRKALQLLLLLVPVFTVMIAALTTWWALVGLAAAPVLFLALQPVTSGKKGTALIPVLGFIGRAMVLWTVAIALAIALTG